MMAKKTLFVPFLVLFITPLLAVEGRLAVTTYANFFDRWYKSNAEVPLGTIPQTSHVYKRQAFYMLPLISGFSTDAKKKANITYHLTIKKGAVVLLDRKNVKGLTKVVNDTSAVFLCETVLNYEFTADAKEGEYEIEITITDNTNGQKTTFGQTITVSTYKYIPRKFAVPDSFFVWQNYCYEGLEPDREIDGLLFFSQPKMQTDPEKTLPMLGFFAELFKGKFYLLNAVEEHFTKMDTNERLTTIHILNLVSYAPQSLQKKFNADEKQYYQSVKGYGLPIIPDSTVKNPYLLNLLWAKFFASGSFEHAKKIAETLELGKYEGAMARYNESGKTEKDQQEAFWETIYQKTMDDLLTRLPNHPLFNGYCLYILNDKETSHDVAEQLERVVVR
ncbi:MAG: hypothetical protein ACO1PI_06955 [Bacteroidota bacterium]